MGCVTLSPCCKLCRMCASLCKMVPVLVISGIVGWSYYAYVIHLCIMTVESDIERIGLLIGYHIAITLFLLCYWRTIWTRPGKRSFVILCVLCSCIDTAF